MVPEILIVGDPSRRRELIHRVRAEAYEVTLCRARELNRRVRSGPAPAAIVLCTADGDPGLLLAALRRSRQGAAIPVILYGRLGGDIRELADVLDLGADHFVADTAPAAELTQALFELAGPSTRTETQIDDGTGGVESVDTPRNQTGWIDEPSPPERWPENTELIDRPRNDSRRSRTRLAPSDSDALGSDEREVLGDLRQTLDRLEARLRTRGSEQDFDRRRERPRGPRRSSADWDDHEVDDIDLNAMGMREIPDVVSELEHAGSDTGGSQDLEADLDDVDSRPGTLARPRRPSNETALRGRRPGRGKGSTPDEQRGRRTPAMVRDSLSRLPPSGSLDGSEVPRVLWALHGDRFTGSLTLRRGRAEKRVWLRDGEVVFVRSNLSSDRLVDGLLKRGVLTRAQYETARRLAAKEPRRVGQLLIDSGFVKPRELALLLRDHLSRLLDGTFGWQEGSWSTNPGDECDESVLLDKPIEALLLEGIRGRLEVGELERRLGPDATLPRLIVEGRSHADALREATQQLQLLPEEEHWVEKFDGRHSVDDLLQLGGDDEQGLLSLMYAMHVCERLAWGLAVGTTRRGRDGHGGSGSVHEMDVAGEPARDPAQIDHDRLQERVRLAREADYFDLLGVSRDATRADVRRASDALLQTFEEDAVESTTSQRNRSELDEVRAALTEAREILMDDALRSAYLAHLGEPDAGP